MRPKPIPLLNEEQFAEIAKEMKRTPSKEDVKRFKRAKEILKRHSI